MINIGINGFGRIGKGLLRIIQEEPDSNINIIGIKDYNSTNVSNQEFVKNMAYLLQNDSIYGEFPSNIDVEGTNLIINSKKIPIFLESDILSVDWNKLGCEVLIESSGSINNMDNKD